MILSSLFESTLFKPIQIQKIVRYCYIICLAPKIMVHEVEKGITETKTEVSNNVVQ